jgi:hypothetical protein
MYINKYLKYKNKYLNLLSGGGYLNTDQMIFSLLHLSYKYVNEFNTFIYIDKSYSDNYYYNIYLDLAESFEQSKFII